MTPNKKYSKESVLNANKTVTKLVTRGFQKKSILKSLIDKFEKYYK